MTTTADPSAASRLFARSTTAIIVAGVLLRVVVFLTAGPFNADEHWAVVQYFAEHGRPPTTELLGQAHHPPLYYLLMLPLADADLKWAHATSLAFSCANLLLIGWVLRRVRGVFPDTALLAGMAFAAFLPQYVMFGSFVSNDTLTILLGTGIFAAALAYLNRPGMGRVVALGVLTGLGLLTKGTFLLTGAALVPVVWLRDRHAAMPRVIVFVLLWAALGCYKYVENALHLGQPFVHHLDFDPDWAKPQKGVWQGPQTLCDVNVLKLVRHPILLPGRPFSYPLLMYGTFWYPHIPDSTYRGSIHGYAWVGSLIYALAAVPTAAFLIGVALAVASLPGWLRGEDNPRVQVEALSLLLLAANATVVLGAGVRYDVWSCFQSRLCFQSLPAMLILFGAGLRLVPASPWARWPVYVPIWAAAMSGLVYFAVEVGLYVGVLEPGPLFVP